jgi:hypothetical protein
MSIWSDPRDAAANLVELVGNFIISALGSRVADLLNTLGRLTQTIRDFGVQLHLDILACSAPIGLSAARPDATRLMVLDRAAARATFDL